MAGSSKWSGILSIAKKLRPKAAQAVAQQQVQVETPLATERPAVAPDVLDRVLVDSYSVYEPYVRIVISLEPDGTSRYIVVEPRLTKTEKKLLREIKDALKNGLELDVGKFKPEEAEAYLTRETLKIMKRFGIRIPKFTFDKLFYFIRRDYLHYSIIDPLMRDPNIEDISCNGPGTPIYVFQRNYESIPTNVSFKTQDDLEKFIMRMAYMSGRHISVSEPVVDASLPEGSRIQMTFGTEITKKGSTFTIRKFKEDPYSIIDLIKFGTLDSEIASLFWYLLENKGSVLLAGGTASGKTTSINCLALFIRPEAKIVTIEDTPEINLAHSNWIESISRQGTAGIGEVSLYDLLRAALRQRPDFIIVGEVRGEEAYTMFQALSTGHAGLSSIHADSISAVFHRLTNPPMNIPRTLIPAVNLVVHQARITVNNKPVRRMLSVTEIVGLDTRTSELITNEVYRYDPTKDRFVFAGRSYVLEKMAKDKGVNVAEVKAELATRSQVIQWMAKKGSRQYREVANVIQRYYTDKAGLLAEIGAIVL